MALCIGLSTRWSCRVVFWVNETDWPHCHGGMRLTHNGCGAYLWRRTRNDAVQVCKRVGLIHGQLAVEGRFMIQLTESVRRGCDKEVVRTSKARIRVQILLVALQNMDYFVIPGCPSLTKHDIEFCRNLQKCYKTIYILK